MPRTRSTINISIENSVGGVSYATVSEAGPNRLENQDRTYSSVEDGFFSIADGMGGHADGALAADLAISLSRNHFASLPDKEPNRLAKSVKFAAGELYLRNLNSTEKMGSTLTCLHIDKQLNFAHIGDCRIYIYQDNFIEQITVDHNSRNVLFGGQNMLTKSLGFDANVEPQVGTYKLSSRTSILLCSDGFYSELGREYLKKILYRPSSGALQAVARKIMAGSPHDNFTATLIWRSS